MMYQHLGSELTDTKHLLLVRTANVFLLDFSSNLFLGSLALRLSYITPTPGPEAKFNWSCWGGKYH